MARLALLAAMREELQAVLDRMPDEARVQRAGRDFWVGHLCGHDVVAVLSRIGKVAAATTAAVALGEFGCDRLVFTGTAGGLGRGVAVGDIVVADTLMQHDLDASPLFPRYEVPLYGRDRFETDPALTDAVARAATAMLDAGATPSAGDRAAFGIAAPRMHRGLIVSGDRFVSTAAENAALRAALPKALAVEMEGAAVAQVCHDFGVPFAVVRTVSDRADATAHTDFVRFVEQVASRYAIAIVEGMLA